MTNELAFKQGFTKQAQENGLTQKQAEAFFEKNADQLTDLLAELGQARISENGGPSRWQLGPISTARDNLNVIGGGIGALGGGVLGAGIGALNGSKDDKGETHRLRNALLGGLGGGALGAGAGVGLGSLAGHAVNEEDYNSVGQMISTKNNALQAIQPYKDKANQAVDFFKQLVR